MSIYLNNAIGFDPRLSTKAVKKFKSNYQHDGGFVAVLILETCGNKLEG